MITKKQKPKLETQRLKSPPHSRRVVGKRQGRRAATHETGKELRSVFDAITDPIIVFDAEFRVVKINAAAREFFTGCPVGKKCFFTKHKFALACKDCPTWQTLKTGVAKTGEIQSPKTSAALLLKTYPIYNRLKNIKGVVLVGRESRDVPLKWKRQKDY